MSRLLPALLLALTLTACGSLNSNAKRLVSTQVLVAPHNPPLAPPPEFVPDCADVVPFETNPDGTATRGQVVTNQMVADKAIANCREVQKGLLKAWPTH